MTGTKQEKQNRGARAKGRLDGRMEEDESIPRALPQIEFSQLCALIIDTASIIILVWSRLGGAAQHRKRSCQAGAAGKQQRHAEQEGSPGDCWVQRRDEGAGSALCPRGYSVEVIWRKDGGCVGEREGERKKKGGKKEPRPRNVAGCS